MNPKKTRRNPRHFSFADPEQFRSGLLAWFKAHARPLPWRENRDPYRVWISEIMLQQTRVAAVIAHYHAFLRRFPTVQKLAAAREDSVLAAWSGLGYYRRARMMHAAAKVIALGHDGEFPATAEALSGLPGIGRYTAAAIASIAFGEPTAVVDGNVERVLQRLSGKRLAGEGLWDAANQLLDASRPGDFNQAMMDLGAVVCTPRAPGCLACPVRKLCRTRGELAALKKPVPQRKREVDYALDVRNRDGSRGEVFIVQRARDGSLMPGMWELPEAIKIPEEMQISTTRPLGRRNNKSAKQIDQETCLTLRHSITVSNYTVRVWRMTSPAGTTGKWMAVARLPQLALTGLARKIFRKTGLLC